MSLKHCKSKTAHGLYSPDICLSGNGGIGTKQQYLSNSRSCSQSKCLYLRDTCMLLN